MSVWRVDGRARITHPATTGQNSSSVQTPAQPNPLGSRLVDGSNLPPDQFSTDFSAADTGRFIYSPSTAIVSGGQATLTPTTGFNNYVVTNAPVDLTGGRFMVEIPQVPNPGTTLVTMYAYMSGGATGGNSYAITFDGSNNTTRPRRFLNGSLTAVAPGAITYSATNHRWWSIREDQGIVYLEVSPDGVNWTLLGSEVRAFNLNSVFLRVEAGENAADASPGVAVIDNFNVVPSGQALTASPADTLGATDTADPVQGVVEAPADTGALADAVTADLARSLSASPADALGSTDAAALGRGTSATDTLGATDAAGLGRQLPQADTLGSTDAVTAAQSIAQSPADFLGSTDTTSADVRGHGGKMSTLVDTFTTLDSSLWSSTGASIVGDQLQITSTTDYNYLGSLKVYDLTDSSVYVEVPQTSEATAGNPASVDTMMILSVGTNRAIYFYREGDLLYTEWDDFDLATTGRESVTYSATAHRWWRISESGGVVTWSASPDGVTWTTIGTPWATPWSLTDVGLNLTVGFFDTTTAATPGIFDNLNVPQSASTNVAPADTSGGTDAVTLGRAATPADSSGGTDAVTLGRAAAPADTLGSTDAVTLARSVAPADASGGTDSAVVDLARQLSQAPADALGSTDAVALAREIVPSAASGSTTTTYATSQSTLNTWTGPSNVQGAPNGTYAFWTSAVSGASARMRGLGYDPAAAIPSGGTPSTVDVLVTGFLTNSTANIATATVTLNRAANNTVIATLDLPLTLTAQTQTITFSGVTLAQLTGGVYVDVVLARAATTASDTYSIDAIGVRANYVTAGADMLGSTDSATAVLARALTVQADDTAGLVDTPQSLQVLTRSLGDALGSTDLVDLVQDQLRAIPDTLGATDTPTSVQGLARSQADQLGAADTPATVQALARTQADPLGSTDLAQPELAGATAQTPVDPLGIIDQATIVRTVVQAAVDVASGSDAADVGQSRAVADPAGLTDTPAVAQGFVRTQTDALGATDSATAVLAGGLASAPADTLGATDAVSVELARQLVATAADILGLADAVAQALDVQLTVAETVELADEVTVALARGIQITVADTLGISDAVTYGAGAVPITHVAVTATLVPTAVVARLVPASVVAALRPGAMAATLVPTAASAVVVPSAVAATIKPATVAAALVEPVLSATVALV